MSAHTNRRLDSSSLVLGYAGVYSSFLLHSQRAASATGFDSKDILLEVGRRRYVGGQEDLIIDAALALSEQPSSLGSCGGAGEGEARRGGAFARHFATRASVL